MRHIENGTNTLLNDIIINRVTVKCSYSIAGEISCLKIVHNKNKIKPKHTKKSLQAIRDQILRRN